MVARPTMWFRVGLYTLYTPPWLSTPPTLLLCFGRDQWWNDGILQQMSLVVDQMRQNNKDDRRLLMVTSLFLHPSSLLRPSSALSPITFVDSPGKAKEKNPSSSPKPTRPQQRPKRQGAHPLTTPNSSLIPRWPPMNCCSNKVMSSVIINPQCKYNLFFIISPSLSSCHYKLVLLARFSLLYYNFASASIFHVCLIIC